MKAKRKEAGEMRTDDGCRAQDESWKGVGGARTAAGLAVHLVAPVVRRQDQRHEPRLQRGRACVRVNVRVWGRVRVRV